MDRYGKVLGTTAELIMDLITLQGGAVVQLTFFKHTNSPDLRTCVGATYLPTTIMRPVEAEVEVVTHIVDSMMVEQITTITITTYVLPHRVIITIRNKL